MELHALGGDAGFDPANNEDGCFLASRYYGAVSDGSYRGKSDAADGGLLLFVQGRSFVDSDGTGALVGGRLKVGPETLAGVKVTRTDTALPGSPTLRDLVRIENTTDRTLERDLMVHTDVGSDNTTIIEATSGGRPVFSRSERWLVTSDAAPFEDPLVTHAFFGKGEVTGPVQAAGAFPDDGSGIGEDCIFAVFDVKLRSGQTSYLLFFLQLAETRDEALDNAAAFDRRKLGVALTDGLSGKVRRKIINWDLG